MCDRHWYIVGLVSAMGNSASETHFQLENVTMIFHETAASAYITPNLIISSINFLMLV